MNIPLIVMGDHTGRYIQDIESVRGEITVARHVHELSDVIGIAQTGIARAVLLVSGFEDLTHSLLSHLEEAELGVVALVDPGDPQPFENIRYISTLADSHEVLKAIEKAVDEQEAGRIAQQQSKSTSDTSVFGADKPTGSVADDYSDVSKVEENDFRQGQLVSVWGTGGSPGRSTVALNLAACAAASGKKVCLVDADTYYPAISALIGMLDDYSGLAQLCHLADRGQLQAEHVAETVSTVKLGADSLDIITGITRADRWPEIRPASLSALLQLIQQHYELVIIDTGFSIEADEELSFDGVAPRRNAATLTALENSDTVIILGNADVLGIPRLFKAVDELLTHHSLEVEASKLQVWVNKVREGSVGKSPQAQLQQTWNRFGPELPLQGFIPWDQKSLDQAWLSGRALTECAKKQPVTHAIEELLESVLSPTKASASIPGQGSDQKPLAKATRESTQKSSSWWNKLRKSS